MPQFLFNSIPFIFLFLPVSLLFYWGAGLFSVREDSLLLFRKEILIVVSLIFYASFGVYNLVLFLLSVLINFLLFLWMRKRGAGKAVTALGVIFNVLYLCFFKYAGAFTGTEILLPLGISFYTFQQISFLLDYREEKDESYSVLNYFLYILYFPKLLEGPIVRFTDFKGSFQSLGKMTFSGREKKMVRALILFIFGLAKKVLIADTLTKAADYGFAHTSTLYFMDAIVLFFTYLPSLYFDFSGYCDMGMAVSEFFGIELPYNFDRPFLATNVTDFWRRWHISLSRFFVRYIYIPLGGSRKGLLRTCLNSFLIFFISGLWHGVGATFIIWGCMHGALYVVHKLYMIKKKSAAGERISFFGRLPLQVRAIPMYLYAAASFIFFRADTVEDALNVFRKIFSKPWTPMTTKFVEAFERNEIFYIFKMTPLGKTELCPYVLMWAMLVLAYGLTFFSKKAGDLADLSADKIAMNKKGTACFGILLGFLFVWCLLSLSGVSSFAYFNF